MITVQAKIKIIFKIKIKIHSQNWNLIKTVFYILIKSILKFSSKFIYDWPIVIYVFLTL